MKTLKISGEKVRIEIEVAITLGKSEDERSFLDNKSEDIVVGFIIVKDSLVYDSIISI